MKATKAYIASLGTTGVLLAASILMLAVVSAVVAFDAWPSGTVSTRVQRLVLADQATPIRVSATPRATASTARTPGRAARTAAGALRHAVVGAGGHPVSQRVAGERVSGGGNAPGGPGRSSNPVQVPADLPALPDTTTIINGDAEGFVNGAADSAQSFGGYLGGTVGQISPGAGQTVTSVGQTVADTLRQLPLPGPLFPNNP